MAYQLSDRVSIGVGLNGDWATLAVSPFSAAFPDDANGDGFGTYPNGSRSDVAWGLGFQAGLYYENADSGLHLGASVKSPQWLQTFKFNSQDELGAGRTLTFDLDYPLIASIGVGCSRWERWRFAADLRYIDYSNTEGFQAAGFAPTGAVTGFGWESIWVVAVGTEYRVTPCFALRCGYTFNESPIRDSDSFFNVAASGVVQHHLSAGFSYETVHDWTLSIAFHRGFQNSVSGPWQSPAGAIPGTTVTSELATYSLTLGVGRRF